MAHDAIIVGGSFAGLAAATYLARARRDVRIIDTGKPRNRFAAHSHGFLGSDGVPPGEILARARDQVFAYPTVSLSQDAALSAKPAGQGFAVTLASGETLEAARLILAYGISDELPQIPGLAERWGHSVIHCPYCHGYEFAGQQLGVLCTMPVSVHQAMLVSEWGPVTFFLNGQPEPDPDAKHELYKRGVAFEAVPVTRLEGEDKALSGVVLADGRSVRLDALYVGLRSHHNSSLAADLGCAMEDVPWGQMIRTDSLQATNVPGVFAAGDIARGGHSVSWAVADGVTAGTAAHRSLVF